MSIIQGNTKVSAGGYEIDQSIRFEDGGPAYLSRTFSTPTDGKTFTWSGWVKRGNFGNKTFISGGGSAEATFYVHNEALEMYGWTGSAYTFQVWSTPVLRDPSAWYHLVAIYDSTEAVSTDRVRFYVNGVETTAFQVSSYPGLNSTTYLNSAAAHRIGYRMDNAAPWDGYMAEINFIDGQALDPTDFGEYNDDGVWVPKAYEGTYGTNGFYITGADSADLGADESGNGNDFTSSGLTADDQMLDTPTDNYTTWNVLDKGNITTSDGNLTVTSGADQAGIRGTIAIPQSGKYYWEITCNTLGYINQIGLASSSKSMTNIHDSGATVSNRGWGFGSWFSSFNSNVTKFQSDVAGSQGTNWTGVGNPAATDVLMVAYDSDNGSLWFGKNGTWFDSSGTADPATNTDPRFSGLNDGTEWFALWAAYSTYSPNYTANFGQSGFTYTPPTGFSALSTANLPTPAIKDGSKYFQTTTYTGAGYPTEVNQSGNSTFQPDFVWIKRRNAGTTHDLFDAVRGVSSQLYSNLTNAEGTVSNAISFDADGFTAAADPITGDTGSSGNTFVGWQWLAANGTSSNTDGSITSTVSANVDAGFSVIGYTASGTTGATLGHGLSQAPDFIVAKDRDSGANQWIAYHSAEGATRYALLNANSAFNTNSGAWNNTEPTSSLVTLGSSAGWANNTGNDHIMYCWHSVEGFSRFGKYTGNGSTDGPFIYTGFKPAFVMTKRTNSADNWAMYDAARDPYNVAEKYLYADLSNAEATFSTAKIDFLSNGFKWRGAVNFGNASGGTYIFMAFAEHPFGGDGVAPVPAR
jgi:hypothetical protein